jgi:hypothetical protein
MTLDYFILCYFTLSYLTLGYLGYFRFFWLGIIGHFQLFYYGLFYVILPLGDYSIFQNYFKLL